MSPVGRRSFQSLFIRVLYFCSSLHSVVNFLGIMIWSYNVEIDSKSFIQIQSWFNALIVWSIMTTALFNNMRTLKFKGRPTNSFFAAVNQMFGGSSQITTTAEHRSVVWTVHSELITARSAVIGSREEPRNIWLTVAKNPFIGWALNLRVRMLLKGAVMNHKVFSTMAWFWYIHCEATNTRPSMKPGTWTIPEHPEISIIMQKNM